VTSAVLFSEKIMLSAPVGYLEYSEKATKKAKNFIDTTTAKNSRKDRTMASFSNRVAERISNVEHACSRLLDILYAVNNTPDSAKYIERLLTSILPLIPEEVINSIPGGAKSWVKGIKK
jgi:hypothetical protein